MSAVLLVFLAMDMALVVSGFTSFHLHNNLVNLGHPPGLVPISSFDGLLYFSSAFSAPGKAINKVLHFFHSGCTGWGGINRLSTVWSASAQLGLREKQLS